MSAPSLISSLISLNASAEFAAASPDPDPSELMDDIYWETDNPELKTSEGRIFFEHP